MHKVIILVLSLSLSAFASVGNLSLKGQSMGVSKAQFKSVFDQVSIVESSKNIRAHCFYATNEELSDTLAQKLCKNAISIAPAECYKSTPKKMDKKLSIELCQFAKNLGPMECFKSTPSKLSNKDSVSLCKQAKSSAPALCFHQSKGNLKKRIEKCKTNLL